MLGVELVILSLDLVKSNPRYLQLVTPWSAAVQITELSVPLPPEVLVGDAEFPESVQVMEELWQARRGILYANMHEGKRNGIAYQQLLEVLDVSFQVGERSKRPNQIAKPDGWDSACGVSVSLTQDRRPFWMVIVHVQDGMLVLEVIWHDGCMNDGPMGVMAGSNGQVLGKPGVSFNRNNVEAAREVAEAILPSKGS